jgi:hypothetical protein
MIAVRQTGQIAGSVKREKVTDLTGETLNVAALEAYLLYKRVGAAHIEPQSDFVTGFISGYINPVTQRSGLALFVQQQVERGQ